MAGTPVVSPADVVKIVLYNQNVDGSLTAAALSQTAATPVVLPTNAQPSWAFTQNVDGSLSPFTVS